MMIYPTKLVYYDEPYGTELDTFILRVDNVGDDQLEIVLDATLFYPFGGGQPADQGVIRTQNGQATVKNVQMKPGGVVIHECALVEGEILDDEDAHLTLDWERRYKNMRVHTAGHVIHDVLLEMVDNLTPVRGNHGSKPSLEYRAEQALPIDLADTLAQAVNALIQEGREVVTRETSLDELETIARFIPPNLPRDKPLRMIQIAGYPAMPDGGTQVKDVREVGGVTLTSVKEKKGVLTIKYRVD